MSSGKKIISIRTHPIRTSYEIAIGSGLLPDCGKWAREKVSAEKLAIVSNPTVFKLYGETLVSGLEKAGFKTAVWLMKDGERFKDLRSLEGALKSFNEIQL